jgi:hypothetical protein
MQYRVLTSLTELVHDSAAFAGGKATGVTSAPGRSVKHAAHVQETRRHGSAAVPKKFVDHGLVSVAIHPEYNSAVTRGITAKESCSMNVAVGVSYKPPQGSASVGSASKGIENCECACSVELPDGTNIAG